MGLPKSCMQNEKVGRMRKEVMLFHKRHITTKTKPKKSVIRTFNTKRSLFSYLEYTDMANMQATIYIITTRQIQNWYTVLMYPWHVSATSSANVLITNEGGKFQSRWEVADLSTIITSSKSNLQDED